MTTTMEVLVYVLYVLVGGAFTLSIRNHFLIIQYMRKTGQQYSVYMRPSKDDPDVLVPK